MALRNKQRYLYKEQGTLSLLWILSSGMPGGFLSELSFKMNTRNVCAGCVWCFVHWNTLAYGFFLLPDVKWKFTYYRSACFDTWPYISIYCSYLTILLRCRCPSMCVYIFEMQEQNMLLEETVQSIRLTLCFSFPGLCTLTGHTWTGEVNIMSAARRDDKTKHLSCTVSPFPS